MNEQYIEVAKFGGTSVCHPDIVTAQIETIDPNIVVVSAPGKNPADGMHTKVTDMLMPYEEFIDRNAIRQRFQAIGAPQAVTDGIWPNLREWGMRGFPRQALGEYWSAQTYAHHTDRTFVDAAQIIRFNPDGSFNARVTDQLIQAQLDPDERYVVPGFYGSDETGRIHVFPRGGSDITGAIIARALGTIGTYYNCSDVDGFMTDNPRINPDAELIEAMTYERALRFADQGCELLHPEVCRILGDTAIRTIMCNTFGALGNRGTVVSRSLETVEVV